MPVDAFDTKQRRRSETVYRLDDQVGFILRQAAQRHTSIFVALMVEDLTPTQFAALAKLAEVGPSSQNKLGRLTAMDGATIKGVIDRLTKRGLTETSPDPDDGRLLVVALTALGRAVAAEALPAGTRITEETLAPLTPEEQAQFLALLRKLR
ncbi:transcriptional regulator [Aliidongia dinghuensis]|uniref:Transcriptional regulator n=1 Tax=Aliidongia dinghuensis TaxID=1867774 RepID=A0A8J2YTT6_9PROT|nr:MarR family transcriptional regulator [Aliidongia dinghuensis]GGF20910.1 transcriptional regulator [Aliidongia dinghuensis]